MKKHIERIPELDKFNCTLHCSRFKKYECFQNHQARWFPDKRFYHVHKTWKTANGSTWPNAFISNAHWRRKPIVKKQRINERPNIQHNSWNIQHK